MGFASRNKSSKKDRSVLMKTDTEILKEITAAVKKWDHKRFTSEDRNTIYEVYSILKEEGIL
jgi:hypothetical protein